MLRGGRGVLIGHALCVLTRTGMRGAHGVIAFLVKLQELNCFESVSGYFTQVGDKATPTARDSSEFARA